MNIKMIVAVHKDYLVPNDEIYLPVHVGAEGKQNLGFVGDNTGQNISDKNAYYCELTGLYWAWKNLDYDVIGLVHYRRYFGKKITGNYLDDMIHKEEIEKILENYDILLPKVSNYYIETIESHLNNHLKLFTNIDYISYVRNAIANVAPEYTNELERCLRRTKGHMCNMFVMRKQLFDEYCTWLFEILIWMEDNHSLYTVESVMPRIYGFIGEILLDVWVLKNNLAINEYPVISLEDRSKARKAFDFCKRKFLGIK